MSETVVGIGETSSFRYFGVMPPLDNEEAEALIQGLTLPLIVSFDMGYTQHRRNDSPEHTEFWVGVGEGIDWLGVETVDEESVKLAEQIAKLLRQEGRVVEVLKDIVCTDWRTPIFGEDADEQGDLREHFREHRTD